MYTTIEADIENGQVRSPEIQKLPSVAHVLITLLSPEKGKRPDWSAIKGQLGKLQLRGDSVDWQRKIRSEWD
jgi:hypothetical protein